MADKYVGKRIKRTEDPRLIKGLAHYVDDIGLPGTLHVAFVRSMYAHARITGIDSTDALKVPGVVAVYTGKDIATKVGPVPCAAALPDLKSFAVRAAPCSATQQPCPPKPSSSTTAMSLCSISPAKAVR